jgi:hypothetical protein
MRACSHDHSDQEFGSSHVHMINFAPDQEFACSHIHLLNREGLKEFACSVPVNDRHVVVAEKLVERLAEQGIQ